MNKGLDKKYRIDGVRLGPAYTRRLMLVVATAISVILGATGVILFYSREPSISFFAQITGRDARGRVISYRLLLRNTSLLPLRLPSIRYPFCQAELVDASGCRPASIKSSPTIAGAAGRPSILVSDLDWLLPGQARILDGTWNNFYNYPLEASKGWRIRWHYNSNSDPKFLSNLRSVGPGFACISVMSNEVEGCSSHSEGDRG